MITDVRLGDTQAVKMYSGEDVVWEKDNGGLPVGYKRCKYLESSGKQGIAVPVNVDDTLTAEARFCRNEAGETLHRVFGIYKNKERFQFSVGKNAIIGYGSDLYRKSFVFDANWHTVLFGGSGVYLDGNLVYKPTSKITLNDTYNLGVFFDWDEITYYGAFFGKISHFNLRNRFGDLYSAIPAIDRQNRPCMYDTVSNRTFYNVRSGEFGYELMSGTYVAPI